MAVNWYWKDHLGYLKFKIFDNNGNYKGIMKVDLYQANCLGALIYHYKDKETKEKYYSFQGYWSDRNHLKNILGLSKEYKNKCIYKDSHFREIISINLNTFFTRNRNEIKDMKTISSLFTEAHIKVNFYYKEIKEKKERK